MLALFGAKSTQSNSLCERIDPREPTPTSLTIGVSGELVAQVANCLALNHNDGVGGWTTVDMPPRTYSKCALTTIRCRTLQRGGWDRELGADRSLQSSRTHPQGGQFEADTGQGVALRSEGCHHQHACCVDRFSRQGRASVVIFGNVFTLISHV